MSGICLSTESWGQKAEVNPFTTNNAPAGEYEKVTTGTLAVLGVGPVFVVLFYLKTGSTLKNYLIRTVIMVSFTTERMKNIPGNTQKEDGQLKDHHDRRRHQESLRGGDYGVWGSEDTEAIFGQISSTNFVRAIPPLLNSSLPFDQLRTAINRMSGNAFNYTWPRLIWSLKPNYM
ncbi:hypothetical protein N7532_001461 [Penicillium argentinense]|uniref:Uncharacterized protein n=1 Tax=Penicillium argentinense TaxID=1131581 RepID=A0A9W9KMG5_9EURO|nr:uncharacterized protein N7532_001461 [Penicillium argentinense]KAJ5110926.1 hypothetical protein N7532_001461 [Penicillium argentinense]